MDGDFEQTQIIERKPKRKMLLAIEKKRRGRKRTETAIRQWGTRKVRIQKKKKRKKKKQKKKRTKQTQEAYSYDDK